MDKSSIIDSRASVDQQRLQSYAYLSDIFLLNNYASGCTIKESPNTMPATFNIERSSEADQ